MTALQALDVEPARIATTRPFLLTDEERCALLRALYVVKDNWWLDAVEDALLARLEAFAEPATPARPRFG